MNVNTTAISVRDNPSLLAAFQIIQRTSLLQHQFLAGWMSMSDPRVTELPLGGDGPNDAGNPLGSGVLNSFWADSLYPGPRNEGVLQAKVTGTLPVEGEFEGGFRLGKITLPDAWPQLAQRFATDANPNNENPSNRWDIHDQSDLGSFATEGHPFAPADACGPTTRPVNVTTAGPILDAVDNCDGGYAFSRVFDADGAGAIPPVWLGLSQEPTRGPFDPQREDATFLPDGYLTADDAPMPAARIDFTIAPNKHDNKDIDGVGSFGKTDKSKLYSADRPANANAGSGDASPHNLYAPFYSAYIPQPALPIRSRPAPTACPGTTSPATSWVTASAARATARTTTVGTTTGTSRMSSSVAPSTAYDTKCLRREDQVRQFRHDAGGRSEGRHLHRRARHRRRQLPARQRVLVRRRFSPRSRISTTTSTVAATSST